MTPTIAAILLAISVLAASLVAFLAWPGFMTFDSVFALEQARTGIVNGGYPPMVSYLWRVVEMVLPGQGGMFFLQLLLLFVACVTGTWLISRSWVAAIATACLIPLLPAIAGPLLVVWKDILFAGAAILALSYSYWVYTSGVRSPRRVALACLLLVFAAMLRINGLPALLPGFYLIAKLLAGYRAETRVWLSTLMVCAALVLVTTGLVLAVSTWRLPDLRHVESQSTHRYVMFHDLLGISACMGVQVFDDGVTGGTAYSADQLRRIYHPEHVQRTFQPGPDVIQEARLDGITTNVWAAEVATHFNCYAWHKLQVAQYQLGMNDGDVFYVTDPSLYPNRFGLAAPDPAKVGPMLRNVLAHQSSMFARPVFYFAMAVLLASLLRLRTGRWCLPGTLVTGAVLYFSASLFVYAAADLRYQYFEVMAAFVAIMGSLGWLATNRRVAADPASASFR